MPKLSRTTSLPALSSPNDENLAAEEEALSDAHQSNTRSASTQTSEESHSVRSTVGLRSCNETLVDVFWFLNRADLEAVQYSSRAMRSVVVGQMEDKCFRRLEEVTFGRLSEKRLLFSAHVRIGIDEGSKYVQCAGTNHEERCIALMKRCVTQRFSICNVTFDQRVACIITTVAAHIRLNGDLRLCDDSFARLTDAVNDALLRAFDDANVDSIFVISTHTTVTDDGVIFYMLEKPPTKRSTKNVHFDTTSSTLTSALFEKLVTASYACKHPHNARLTCTRMRLEDQNVDAHLDRSVVDGSGMVFIFNDADVPFHIVFRKVNDVDEMVYTRGCGCALNG